MGVGPRLGGLDSNIMDTYIDNHRYVMICMGYNILGIYGLHICICACIDFINVPYISL